MKGTTDSDEERLARAVLHMNGNFLGLALGFALGLVIFVATIWLVVKGGNVVGPHLSLLSQYFYGYNVTVGGSFIGLAYGFLAGYLSGWIIAWIYNRVVLFKEGRH